jgi:peptidoglycan-associated lipoprotein
MKSPTHRLLLLTAVLATLAGCETTKLAETTPPPVETRRPVPTTTAAPATPATSSATPQSRVATVDLAANNPGSGVAGASASGNSPTAAAAAAAAVASTAALAMPSQRVVYFDFDSYVIKDDFKGLMESYAKALGSSRGKKLVIEGHTDERGGREYNLALGQKRAEAVVQTLTLLGAANTQLEAVSFGEERPADPGHDEAAWAKNRRAELKDR